MNHAEAMEKIVAALSSELGMEAGDISTDTNLRDDLGLDSLDLVELVAVLEDELDNRVPQDQFDNIDTVGDVVELVVSLAKSESGVA